MDVTVLMEVLHISAKRKPRGSWLKPSNCFGILRIATGFHCESGTEVAATNPYFEGHPYLTERAAEWLAKAGAALVGIDSLNIDSVATGERPVHTVLLGNEIPIVEHVCGLSALPDQGSRFFAVPVKVKAFGTFPVRAFALA
jgi:kynurenine formamidase